jgi:hypothetical protein
MAFLNKNTVLALAALVACGTAAATEDYDLRYAPGYGAADMSAPFEGGWVFQAHAYAYSGNVRGTTVAPTIDLSGPLGIPIAGAVTAQASVRTNTQINVYGVLSRLSYMSSTKFLGGTLGGTALLPLLNKASNITVTGVSSTLGGPFLGAIDSSTQAFLTNFVNDGARVQGQALAAGSSNKTFNVGDLELSPILRWSTEATQTLFVLTAVMPTGDYDPARAANPSAGNFWTFRPAVQFSYIGDGWDFGSRLAYSFNTINKTTKYKSGSYLNVDLAAMKSVSESTRVGLSGYAVDQLNKDTSSLTTDECVSKFGAAECPIIEAREAATLGQKGRIFGVGPEVAYIHGAGDFLVEGRIMKEFGAQSRPKGFTAFLTLSKPF